MRAVAKNASKVWDTKARAVKRRNCKAKVRYDSWDAAHAASGHWSQFAYVCSVCAGYHLSSKR